MNQEKKIEKKKINIPWYLIGFLGATFGLTIISFIDWRIGLGVFLISFWDSIYLQGDRDDIDEIKHFLNL